MFPLQPYQVGIQKKQNRTVGVICSCLHSPSLAQVFLQGNYLNGIPLGRLDGSVSGTVADHDDLIDQRT